jgi:hypothetical protein
MGVLALSVQIHIFPVAGKSRQLKYRLLFARICFALDLYLRAEQASSGSADMIFENRFLLACC